MKSVSLILTHTIDKLLSLTFCTIVFFLSFHQTQRPTPTISNLSPNFNASSVKPILLYTIIVEYFFFQKIIKVKKNLQNKNPFNHQFII